MIAIFLERVDSVPLQNESFSFEFYSWVTNLVDTLNSDLEDVQNSINGSAIASFASRKTTAEITALIGMNANPVLEVGAMWFDTTISKLKVLVTAAVPGISNGITETVTSV